MEFPELGILIPTSIHISMNLFPDLHLVPYINVFIVFGICFSFILCQLSTFSFWIFFWFNSLLVLVLCQDNELLLILL